MSSEGGVTTEGVEVTRGRLLEVWPQKCVFVVEEILKTEQDYVASLRQIIEVGGGGGGGKGVVLGKGGRRCGLRYKLRAGRRRAPPFVPAVRSWDTFNTVTPYMYGNSMFV